MNFQTVWFLTSTMPAEEISGVLDGVVTPEDDDSADYPCETTMHRWHCWLEANRLRIDGYLKSTDTVCWDSPQNFWDPGCRCSISCEVHDRNGWKRCSGFFIIPEDFLFRLNLPVLHRLCFAVPLPCGTLPAKEVMTNENKRSHKVAGGTGTTAVQLIAPLPGWIAGPMQSGSSCGKQSQNRTAVPTNPVPL